MPAEICPGPLIWFDLESGPPAAILECARCGFVCTTGNSLDEAHAETPLLREGMASR